MAHKAQQDQVVVLKVHKDLKVLKVHVVIHQHMIYLLVTVIH